ncbi:MAG TPA: hypothetical protein VKP78_02665 [bacterium]|nr:hypothetical protein [bacterium]
MNDKRTCNSCKNRGVYWILATPMLITLVLVSIALWQFTPVLTIIYVALWIFANFCEGYCCADLQCPLAGKWCHPIGAFIFSSFIYEKFFYNGIDESRQGLNMFMELGSTFVIIIIILFPIYWLYSLNPIFGIGYPLLCLTYAYFHFCLICMDCPVSDKCITKEVRKYICWRKDEIH